MTLAETLQIKHFQLSAGPELKANSCASHSLSSTYSQPRSTILCFSLSFSSPALPFLLSFKLISPSLSLLMTFFVLLHFFYPCFSLFSSLFPFLYFFFSFCLLFWFLNHVHSVDWWFVDLRVKVFLLSPRCLMGGTPRRPKLTHNIIKYYGSV